jgi:hypothetical protein
MGMHRRGQGLGNSHFSLPSTGLFYRRSVRPGVKEGGKGEREGKRDFFQRIFFYDFLLPIPTAALSDLSHPFRNYGTTAAGISPTSLEPDAEGIRTVVRTDGFLIPIRTLLLCISSVRRNCTAKREIFFFLDELLVPKPW